jgi:two-component system nitrogen regulation response regulator GlnG
MGDESTVRAPERAQRTARRSLLVTILCHPDLARVGAEARISEGPIEISRAAPIFGDGLPLADAHVSRRGLALRRDGDRLVIIEGGTPARVDGEPLAGTLTAALDPAGVVIELADRVALLVHLGGPPREPCPAYGILGENQAIQDLRLAIRRVADLDVPVLVRGETGSGKELVARALHAAGRRAAARFVPVNLAAVPPSLAAAEMFGAARGAFSGAAQDRRGWFEEADGGTLFLDEIGEAPPDVQATLLRVLETGEVTPVGSTSPRKVRVRVVAATDRDLEAAIAAGSFRAPLLHRLAACELAVPPLRARRDDLGRLFVQFLRRELEALGEREPPSIPASLIGALARHAWPGNVRELANVVRGMVLHRGERGDLHLPERLAAAPSPMAGSRRGAVDEAALIAALAEHGWRPGAAARALGISKTTLYGLIDASPAIRKARDLSAEEIVAAREAAGGDLDATAASLRVSPRGLRLRLRELGL